MSESQTYAGRTALVTGASSGIGAGLARALAARGADLVLVARRAAALEDLAAQVRAEHGRRVDVVPADLAVPGAGRDLHTRVLELGLHVDLLVNNAGFGVSGPVAGADADALVAQVPLNCSAVVDLTTRFLPAMVARRSGAVVNVASVAALQPVPGMAVYAATKAFVLSFTEALWAEQRGSGVRILAVCPGPTDTPFFEVAGEDALGGLPRRTVDDVVATTLRALASGGPSVVDGPLFTALGVVAKVLPRRVVAQVSGIVARPKR
ncbi:SDR family NAD(P)-dependent oxidoreductase [Kineococcus sp. NPDC059986]|jgi:short-subunit dehydrogenase|uniref:SDR family NAD(P)-dependent oxidoreductase n=1 Tax=Kineococcus sp. NPDC059986 TaxID=3155538 RepID=UPI003450BC24